MLDIPLLKKVCELPGAPGFEHRIRDFVKTEITPLVDKVEVDSMGNLIAIRKGKSDKRIMVAAHLDEIAFITTHIDDDGFLRFHTLGGFDPKTLTAQRVIVHGKKDLVGVMGAKPIHVMTAEERTKMPKISDYFIDLGMQKEEVEKYVYVGAPITRERELIEMGSCVNSKSLDNRVSVYILIETLKALKDKEVPYDIYAVFTVQEEIGLRGAINSAGHINPNFGIGLDVTIAYDMPGAQSHEKITSLGKGAAIKIMDGSTVCDTRMVGFMQDVATRHNIPWQPEILPAGGTDTAGLQRYGKDGSIAGAISIPTRNLHQVIEMANKKDIGSCTKLLTKCLSEMDQWNWEL